MVIYCSAMRSGSINVSVVHGVKAGSIIRQHGRPVCNPGILVFSRGSTEAVVGFTPLGVCTEIWQGCCSINQAGYVGHSVSANCLLEFGLNLHGSVNLSAWATRNFIVMLVWRTKEVYSLNHLP